MGQTLKEPEGLGDQMGKSEWLRNCWDSLGARLQLLVQASMSDVQESDLRDRVGVGLRQD